MSETSPTVHWLAALDSIDNDKTESVQSTRFSHSHFPQPVSYDDTSLVPTLSKFQSYTTKFFRIDKLDVHETLADVLDALSDNTSSGSDALPFKLTSLEAFLIRYFVDVLAPLFNILAPERFVGVVVLLCLSSVFFFFLTSLFLSHLYPSSDNAFYFFFFLNSIP